MTRLPLPIEIVRDEPPRPGQAVELAPGLLWARFPLPFRLDHVNVWLLRERDGWTAIDGGLNSEEGVAAWEELLAGPLRGAPLRRLVATHGHTDHVGIAGPLVRRHRIPFLGTLGEWQTARLRRLEVPAPVEPAFAAFLELHGCDAEIRASFEADRRRIARYLAPLPEQLVRIRDGDRLELGGRVFEVIVGGGHADEHASFWCEAENILIAGDQILQRITPVVAVAYQLPEADPLGEYLASLDRFRAIPDDALILPSHGLPFIGLQRRLAELVRHHDDRLRATWDLLVRPMTAAEVSGVLFEKAVKGGQGRLALGETIAHLHRLVAQGSARSRLTEGRLLFEQAGLPGERP